MSKVQTVANWKEWIQGIADGLQVDLTDYEAKLERTVRGDETEQQLTTLLVKNALENIDEANPDWTYVASRLYVKQLYREASYNRGNPVDNTYGNLYGLIKQLTDQGIYTPAFLEKYTEEDMQTFASHIDAKRDNLFNYLALYTLATRYLATDHEKNTYELPQERWMIIAMHLIQDETKAKRNDLVLEAYWALSNLYMTVATPTMNNAGKTHGQLSSCFIDTVDDSLRSEEHTSELQSR